MFLLVDVSGSMNKRIYPSSGKDQRRIDIVKDEVCSYLQNQSGIDRIFLYVFANQLKHFQSFSNDDNYVPSKSIIMTAIRGRKHYLDAIEAIKTIEVDRTSSGTKIWDSLNSILAFVAREEPTLVLCITDGEDMESYHSYSSVLNKAKSYPNLDLRVINICNQLKEPEDKVIRKVKKPENLKDVLPQIPVQAKKKGDIRMKISIPIFSALGTGNSDMEIVRKAMQEVVPYLEKLSELRYYPVPTVIVDEYKFKEMEIVKEVESDEEAKIIIEELLRFITGVCLSIHVGSFYPNNLFKSFPEYSSYSNWSDNSIESLKICCEESLGAYDFINSKKLFMNLEQIPELNNYPGYIDRFEAAMREIITILKNMKKAYGNQVHFADSCWHSNYAGGSDNPNLAIWQKLLSNKDFSRILNRLDQSQQIWNKDLESVIEVSEIILPVLIKKMRELFIMSSKWHEIIRDIRTFGVYLHPSNPKEKLREVLEEQNLADKIHLHETGIVLLCIQRCKARLQRCLENNDNLDESELLEKLLKATLIHEHAHAITYEGVGEGEDMSYIERQSQGGIYFKAVSETLAEWAELNFFRNDNIIFQIIHKHASNDTFPHWPYAGALLLENSQVELPDYTKYSTLMKFFRSNTNAAYRLLRSF